MHVYIPNKSLVAATGAYFTDLWSRLYKTDDYFLDISCKPDGLQSQLSGQITLNPYLNTLNSQDSEANDTESAQITLYRQNQAIAEAKLDEYGQFKIQITQHGIFDLEVRFSKARITVPQLSIY